MPQSHSQEKNTEKLNLLVGIYRVAHDINSTIGLDQCLGAILDTATKLLNVEMASIMLIDRIKNELTIKYAKGLNEKIIREAKSILDQKDPKEVATWVAQRGEPLLIEDIEKDGRFIKRNGKKYANNSLLSVPLKVKDEVIGVLNVNNRKDKGVFAQTDLDILVTLANEVSIAIYNNRLYEDLTTANERLKEVDQLKSDFVANVSHELNMPLATSRYLVSVIEKGIAGTVTPKQKEYLLLIENNIDRLTRLIDNLLNLSRIESGRFELKREALGISDIIREVMELFKMQAASKSIVLEAAFSGGLPKIYADKDRLIQVLVNLLDNAMKFTPDNGRITVSAECGEKYMSKEYPDLDFVKICVSDTGCGIPPEDVNKLFVKFHRAAQKMDAPKIKGTGLGLAITKQITEAHFGRIWVESDRGAGSKFFFTMPVHNEIFFFKEYLDKAIRKANDTKAKFSLLALDMQKPAASVAEEIYKSARDTVRRPTDMVIRLKPENRVMVAADADKAGAACLMERIMKDLKLHKIKDKSGKEISASLRTSIFTFPDDGSNAEELISKTKIKESLK